MARRKREMQVIMSIRLLINVVCDMSVVIWFILESIAWIRFPAWAEETSNIN